MQCCHPLLPSPTDAPSCLWGSGPVSRSHPEVSWPLGVSRALSWRSHQNLRGYHAWHRGRQRNRNLDFTQKSSGCHGPGHLRASVVPAVSAVAERPRAGTFPGVSDWHQRLCVLAGCGWSWLCRAESRQPAFQAPLPMHTQPLLLCSPLGGSVPAFARLTLTWRPDAVSVLPGFEPS